MIAIVGDAIHSCIYLDYGTSVYRNNISDEFDYQMCGVSFKNMRNNCLWWLWHAAMFILLLCKIVSGKSIFFSSTVEL